MSDYSASEEEGDIRIWISYDTYRKILRVRHLMTQKNGKLRTLDETIKELGKTHALNDCLEPTYLMVVFNQVS